MVYGIEVAGSTFEGQSYAAVIVGVADDQGPSTREQVLATLTELRFSGWLGPVQGRWLTLVLGSARRSSAGDRRGVIEVAAELAARTPETVVAVRMLADQQLALAMWRAGEEIGRYVSDPSFGAGEDSDLLPDPFGVHHADAFAAACGHPEAGEELAQVLGEDVDVEAMIESERLTAVLRLLHLPTWIVGSTSLPREMTVGPRNSELTRLGAGRSGLLGWAAGRAVATTRKHRTPPPVVTDAPRGQDFDPWLM